MTPLPHLLRTFSMLCLAWSIVGCVATLKSAALGPTAQDSSPITIRWTTASELDNYGFHVYRGLDEDGPFTRLTPQIVAGAGTTDLPQSYVYEDLTARPGRVYYYWVEAVSLTGTRRQLTPVQAVEAPP